MLSSGDFFDPTELAEAITPQAARQALSKRQYVKAMLLAMRLKDTDLLTDTLLSVPDEQVRQAAPPLFLLILLLHLDCLSGLNNCSGGC